MIQEKIQIPRRVLVVDDQELNRDILGAILEDDYEVLYAENGKEALEIMRANDDLSLVLLDLQMPVMTGFEVLEIVRDDPVLQRIPIIVLTADKSAELQSLKLGAADFITKPFDIAEVVLVRVGRIIELSQGRQLISAAERDPLTSLYNRDFFYEYATRLYQHHTEMHLDAVVMNIEQFHSVNAFHGRAFGDEVLRMIGREIRAFLAGKEGIAGRYAGDTFDIYCLPQPDYRALLNRFQAAVNRISPNVNIRLRMGVRPYEAGVEPNLLFDCAKAACNRARGNFQNSLVFYDEKMHQRELLNLRLINDLRRAAKERQLVVFYQPLYSINADPPQLAGAEALVRWMHPELGMVSPGAFIPLLEGNGLIRFVDSFVWAEAAKQVAAWKKQYGISLPVSVNLSRAELLDPSLIDRLINLIRENGLDFQDYKLEVTESAFAENTEEMLDVVRHLQDLGFVIEMDDFGTGYSTLNMLSDMPFDVLKLDMKFIRNIEHNEKDQRLVNLVFDIAKTFGAAVVVEGVETDGQLEFLKQQKYGLVQGYYFSRPLPPEDFRALIEKEISIDRSGAGTEA